MCVGAAVLHPGGAVFAILALALILIADVLLFKQRVLLRSESSEAISDEPRDAIKRISKLIAEDWHNVGPNYLALPSLSSHAGHVRAINEKAAETEAHRQMRATEIADQYKARVSQLGQNLADGFNKLASLIGTCAEALNHQNARKFQSVGPELQNLGQTFCEQIAEFERLCKSPPDSFMFEHDDGRKERVGLQIDIVEDGSMVYIEAIKPIAINAANILKDPAKSLIEISKHLPGVQAAMGQLRQKAPASAAADQPADEQPNPVAT
jgi:hypothetical protein